MLPANVIVPVSEASHHDANMPVPRAAGVQSLPCNRASSYREVPRGTYATDSLNGCTLIALPDAAVVVPELFVTCMRIEKG